MFGLLWHFTPALAASGKNLATCESQSSCIRAQPTNLSIPRPRYSCATRSNRGTSRLSCSFTREPITDSRRTHVTLIAPTTQNCPGAARPNFFRSTSTRDEDTVSATNVLREGEHSSDWQLPIGFESRQNAIHDS